MALTWIILASILGFSVAAIFAGWLRLQRNVYLMFYIPIVVVLFIFFVRLNDLNFREIIMHNWYWGLAGAALAGAFVIKNVFSQPSSPRNTGIEFFSDILWPGLAYGLIDALLLSVLPILAVKAAFTGSVWIDNPVGRIGLGALALMGSFFVTTAYHWGYPEFRGKKVIWPNIGNGVLTLAYLLTMNPLAAILPHMAMHVAAMIHGRETTGQVPPHYT
jgi:hypothetical protein